MLMADKPFRVGDRIVFGKYGGVVEAMGLRSTRMRAYVLGVLADFSFRGLLP